MWRWAALGSGPVVAGVGYLFHEQAGFFEATWGRLAPAIAEALGVVTGGLPLSLAEAGGVPLAAALLAWLALRLCRVLTRWRSGALTRRAAFATLGAGALNLLAAASVAFASFYLIWGYAAHRRTTADLLGYTVVPSTAEELGALVDALVYEQNELRTRLSEEDGVARLNGGVASGLARAGFVWRRAGERWPVFGGEYAPPKPILLSPVLSAVGLLGIYSPYTGEPNVNTDAPLFALPFSACHEMAHQRGIAREDEANFLAWLVAREFGDVEFRYAASFFATWFATVALMDVDLDHATRAWQGQTPAVRADRAAWTAWSEGSRTRAADAARVVNDTYLKSQGAADGVHSYGRMVDLLLAHRRAGGR
jgi:hypothetical protein